MKKKITIRIKITIVNILLLIVTNLFLTLGANTTAKILINKTINTENKIQNVKFIDENNKDSIKIVNKKFNYMILRNLISIIIIGSLSSYLIIKIFLKPLELFGKEIEKININNLSNKIDIKNCDEQIFKVVNKFNNMIYKLNKSFLLQKSFSQNVAHELRTPLAIIKTRLEVFNKNKFRTKEEYQLLIASMEENVDRLSKIVESLLNIYNFNDIELNQNINLDIILKKIIEELYFYANKKNINIFYESKNVFIKSNELLLYRVFYNIIENAILYGNKNGYVKISISKYKDRVLIIIKDNGVGIPENLKKYIFEPFFRINKNFKGKGLGLSIVHEIIKKLDGNIEVENNFPKGTIFLITL